MKLLLFAVFLSVVQAAPPIPRQAPDDTAQTGKKIKQNANPENEPTAKTMPTVNEDKTDRDKKERQSVPEKNADQTIGISKLPSVSVSRDWIDGISLILTGALVLIGAGGIYAAYRTIESIDRQTDATRIAAIATQRSVELQEVLNRQWLVVENWLARAPGFTTGIAEITMIIGFEIINPTPMPLTLTGLQIKLNGGEDSKVLNHVLAPDRKYSITQSIVLNRHDCVQYNESRFVVIVDGTIHYIDAYKKPQEHPFSCMLKCGVGSGNSEPLIPEILSRSVFGSKVSSRLR
jgi:hypothetical protein